MTTSIKVTLVSQEPGSGAWESRLVSMTTAIVLDELDEPFLDEPTREWADARPLDAPVRDS